MSKNFKYYIFYLLLAIIAYWQVNFFQNMLKWDMVDAYLPWRSFVSESILNFHFPLWNPYQDFGYPIHADMRTIWSPEVWLVSLFGGYSIYTFSVLFIIYTSIAGIGMKLFSNIFFDNNKIAFFTGVIYMLSGYLTGHAQEMSTINSFAFMPIVLYHYFKFFDEVSIKRGVYFILSIFIFLTSAYQAHSFILLYLLIILFGYFVIKLIKNGQGKQLKVFILFHSVFVIIIASIFLPLIISAYQVLPWVSRLSSGVSLLSISSFSFSPQSLLSLILPFAVIRDINYFNTDLSMTNLYFGIIPLVLLLVYFFKIKRRGVFNIVFVFGVISLIASFGDYTPLRKFLFDYVPFMNLFRGSAYFRLFTLIAFSIASGFILMKINEYKKQVLISSFTVFAIILLFVIYSFGNINFKEFYSVILKFSLIDILTSKSSFYENIFIQGIIQLGFLVVFIFLVFKNTATYKYIILLTIVNLIIAVQLNIYSTVVSKYLPKNTHEFLSGLPVGFPVPESMPISECTDKSVLNYPLWRNTSMLSKRISGDSFNSFSLDKTSLFEDLHSDLRDSVTKNQLLYFSTNIKPLSKINDSLFNKSSLFVSDSVYNKYEHITHYNDSVRNDYKITKFEPNSIKADVEVKKNTFLTLIQTNYQGWKVYIDDKPTEIIESNTMFISVYLPKGKHKINYIYDNNIILQTFIISAILILLLIIVAFYYLYSDSEIRNKSRVYSLVFIVIVILITYNQYKYRDRLIESSELGFPQQTYLLDDHLVLNIENKT